MYIKMYGIKQHKTLRIIVSIYLMILEIWKLSSDTLEGVSSVANFITAFEETQ